SPFYAITVGISEVINKHANMTTTVEPVGGDIPNVRSLEAGHIEMALLNSLFTFNGYYGLEPFEQPVDIRIVAQGQPSFRHIIVRNDSGIKTPEDLEGKSIIAIRPGLPELEQITLAMMEVYGVDKSKVNMIST